MTERTWNALGGKTGEILDVKGIYRKTKFYYDRLGRNTAEIDARINSRYKYYDTVGNLVREIDGEGHATDYTYDVFGRRKQVTNALTHPERHQVNGVKNYKEKTLIL